MKRCNEIISFEHCGTRTHELRNSFLDFEKVPPTIPKRVSNGEYIRCQTKSPNSKEGQDNQTFVTKIPEENIAPPFVDVGFILKIMKSRLHDAEVQQDFCQDLWQLAAFPGYRRVIYNTGGLNALLEAMKNHPNDAEVQIEACAAMHRLAITKEINDQIGHAGGIDLITKSLINHSNVKDVQVQSCLLLYTLSSSPSNLRYFHFQDENLKNLLRSTAKRYPTECSEPVRYLLGILQTIAKLKSWCCTSDMKDDSCCSIILNVSRWNKNSADAIITLAE